ncbi:MAG: hypothetical protein K2X45_13795 [Phreatobacter sp.]|jgi:hypothetical protein|nr:hypothetical protein [Phreatobacter sp.]
MFRNAMICCCLGGGLLTAYLMNVDQMPTLACDSLAKAVAYTYPQWQAQAGSFAPKVVNYVQMRCPQAEASVVRELQRLKAQYQIPATTTTTP